MGNLITHFSIKFVIFYKICNIFVFVDMLGMTYFGQY